MAVTVKKACLLGNPSVGKTSLIRRFVLDSFSDRYISTFGTKVTKKELRVDGRAVRLMIWDILGQHEYQRLHETYYRGAAGALIVADCSVPETFKTLRRWADAFHEVNPNAPVVLLLNKADLVDRRRLDVATVLDAAEKLGTEWRYTSAKTGENVEEAFTCLTRRMLDSGDGLEKEVLEL